MVKIAFCGRYARGSNRRTTKIPLAHQANFRKFLLAMKLLSILLVVGSLHVAAHSTAQNVSISVKNVPLKRVFAMIQEQTGYSFLYTAETLVHTRPVSTDLKDQPLLEVLEKLLTPQQLVYVIKSKTIHITSTAETTNILEKLLSSSNPLVRVKITDENGNPLAGASVSVRNSNNAGIAGAEGVYSLTIHEGDVVVVSYVGYQSKNIKVTSTMLAGGTLLITLSKVSAELNEVVVNKGYYTEKQRLSTGNVSRITSEEIERQPVSNVLATLAGRVPGMLVTQSTGLPGGSFKVEVRGRTAIDRSLTDDQPLFIIDGIPVAANNSFLSILPSGLGDPNGIFTAPGGVSPFAGLNTSDIESIEVLKDADATAIYGSRGANGVVLITTKKGKAGKTRISVNAYTGISAVVKPVHTLNTQQYVALRRQAFINDNVTPTLQNAFDIMAWDTTRYTDFNKLLARNQAQTSDVNVSLSGGSESTSYTIGGAYHRETTVLPGSLGKKRGTMHFSLNHLSADQKFNITLTGSYNADENKVPNYDFAKFYNLPPNLKLYEANGVLAFNEGGINTQGPLSNPMAYFKQQYTANTGNLMGNLRISYKPFPGLSVSVNGGYNNILTHEKTLTPASSTNPLAKLGNASNFGETQFVSYLIEPQAEYRRTLGSGELNVIAGGTIQSTNTTTERVNVFGQPSEALLESFTGATNINGSRSSSPYRYNAMFGRINYNLQDRYLLNLTARRDGSSRFGSDKQFANFGSVGAAWIISNESFLQKMAFLSFGKLRGSFGVTGNDKIANYQFLDTWRSSSYNYSTYSSISPVKLFNPYYQWEKTVKKEAALELGFWKDRLQASIVYFHNSSSNQLVQYKLPQITGFSSVVANLPAKVVNKGWELQLTSRNIQTKDVRWSTSINISIPKNVLAEFPALANSSYRNTYVLGKSLNLIYNYQYTGVDPQTGVYTFTDVNKDGFLNEADYLYGGYTDPGFYGGMSNTVSYKNFQLDVFFNFRKQTGKSYTAGYGYSPPGQQVNVPVEMNDFWVKPGDHATFQRLTQSYSSEAYLASINYATSSGIYTDASYIRLANAALSYTLPATWAKKAHMSMARVYVNGQNLFTITGYKVGDPETQDLAVTPPLRTVACGIQLNF